MKTTIKNRMPDKVKLAQLFEVEELEERVEFGKWTPIVKGGGTCTGDFSDCKVKAEVGVKIKF